MSIVKMHNKKTGITYVYESTSYWDKEKKQPRNTRKLIGKLDPVTGEIIPTGTPGRRREASAVPADVTDPGCTDEPADLLASKDAEIERLKAEILRLEIRCRSCEEKLDRIRSILGVQ